MRRRNWQKQITNPLYSIESPRELAAFLMFATLRQAGEPTAEQKARLIELYVSDLEYSDEDATDIYGVASHLVTTDANYDNRLHDIVRPALATATDAQIASLVELAAAIANVGDPATKLQKEFIARVKAALAAR